MLPVTGSHREVADWEVIRQRAIRSVLQAQMSSSLVSLRTLTCRIWQGAVAVVRDFHWGAIRRREATFVPRASEDTLCSETSSHLVEPRQGTGWGRHFRRRGAPE